LLSRQKPEDNPQLEEQAQRGAKALLQALPETDICLYIPSEFVVDHTIHDFLHPEWDAKKHHFAIAQEVLPKSTKVVRVFIGLFLEDSIG
jgi:hypothetical protein